MQSIATRVFLVCCVCCTSTLLVERAWPGDLDVVINEIHYNPASSADGDEFLEIYNRGPLAVDLSDWRFNEGIVLTLPSGIVLEPGSYLVISSNAAATASRYGIQNVFGNYSGSLANGGEVVSLSNSRGDTISRLRYDDNAPWPESPDGLGPTLELRNAKMRSDIAGHWAASLTIDGTPGRPNSVSGPGTITEFTETVFVREGDPWRYFKGNAPFPSGWTGPSFNDSGWFEGPTGIGYGDSDDNTVLADMRNSYPSIATRRTFTVTQEDLDAIGELTFRMVYDDSFVAYLNGVEIGRERLGNPGTVVPSSSRSEPGAIEPTETSLTLSVASLSVGENVLAVQVHNESLGSSDLSCIPTLTGSPESLTMQTESDFPVTINEVKPTESESPGFVELYNASNDAVEIGGFRIVDQLTGSFTLADSTMIGGRDWLVFDDATLGFDLHLAGSTYMLVNAEGHWVDGINPSFGLPGENGFSFGPVPDGSDTGHVMRSPTSGTTNAVSLETDIVINEIQYHPSFVAPDDGCLADCSDLDQWIELHSRSGASVELSGWQLTSAVDLVFPMDTRIDAGGYLVVTRSRDRFLVTHPGVNPDWVLGDWLRALSHGSDRIRLRNALGNVVQETHYGDGKPLNDEDPTDDMDDATFVGSDWPRDSDGSGRSIELANPGLDTSLGGSWRDGPVDGTPAAANQTLETNAPPAIGDVRHSPPVPTSNDSVLVECRVSSVTALSSVSIRWRVDGAAGVNVDAMNDAGIDGDVEAGDGVFSVTLPPQSSGSVVAFEIEAENADATTSVPPSPAVSPYSGFVGPFYLYQILNQGPLANGSTNYLVVMTAADQAELEGRDEFSNVLLPATFIARDDGARGVFQLVGLRYRGSNTRTESRKSYHLEFPSERPFAASEDLNLLASRTDSEILASDFMHRAGLPTPEEWTVNFVFQGSLDRRYVRKERLDANFLSRHFGGRSDGGNLYRAINPDNNGTFPFQGDLSYLGSDPDGYRPYYTKRSNKEADDFNDIIELTRIFDVSETPDNEAFADQLEQLIDVDQWMLFFAANACIANTDGSIHTRSGEDYFLYRVPTISNRIDAGKWLLVPWDIEESFSDSGQPAVPTSVASARRFLRHPRFAPRFHCVLQKLRTGAFSRIQIRNRFPLINFLFDFNTLDGNDAFVASRLGFFDETIPSALTSGASASNPNASLIDNGETWRYFRGRSEPSGGSTAWTSIGFIDSSWEEGPAGFGYGDGDDATLLADMQGNYTTVYIRRVFQVTDPVAVQGLSLEIDYDDGFVAYLNGQIIAQRGVSGSGPFPATATSSDREAGTPTFIDVSSRRSLLDPGDNILAIQGFNNTSGSSDFSLHPALRTFVPSLGSVGCGDVLHALGGSIAIAGEADPCLTASVTVNDQPADYDAFTASWNGAASLVPGDNIVTIKAFDRFNLRVDTREILVRRVSDLGVEVGGSLTSNTTWGPSNGAYLMTSNVTVPAARTLTIEPGTIIFASGGASIIVNGRIDAQGTATNPIRFLAADCGVPWGGIGIENTGSASNILRHCEFERGDNAPGFVGCVSPVNANLMVEDSAFRFMASNAIDGTDARVEVRDCVFEQVREGVHCTRSIAIIQDSFFHRTQGDRDAIDLDFNGSSRSLIERCIFMTGTDDGVDIGGASVDIRDNIFVGIADKAISIEDNGPLGPPSFTGNIMFAGGTAVALKNGVTVNEGHHNTIVGNTAGIDIFAKSTSADGGHALLHSNIVWNNVVDIRVDSLSTLEITESNIKQGWPGAANISSNPNFVDVPDLDFSLLAPSPCLGTGRDGTDMGAVSFVGVEVAFIRGDVDETGLLDINDAIQSLRILFQGITPPECVDRVDSNDDGVLSIVDPMVTLFFLFAGESPPAAPYPDDGSDPTADALPCF